jgi:iron complex transport system substrate-binding protein
MKTRAISLVSLITATLLVLPGGALARNGGVIYPLTLTDSLGQQVTLNAAPERIVSLAPAHTEILWAIGAGDLQVGRTEFCNYPPEVEAIEVVGGFTSDTVSVETIVALEADLVLGSSLQADLAPTFEELGIPFFVLIPVQLRGLYANIMSVGLLTDRAAGAAAVVVDMESRIGAVEIALVDVPTHERKTFFYELWNDPLMTVGRSTFVSEIITTAGGINIFADLAEAYPTISAETVIDRNPDVILGNTFIDAEAIAAREGWGIITAVQDGAIYGFDDDIMQRPGPRMANAVELVARTLYPNIFGE